MKIFYKKKTSRHTDYYFLGLRILRISGYSSRQLHDEIEDVFDYVRACADLKTMPPARGLLRQRQLGMLKILKSNGNEGGTFTSATYSGGNLTLAISGGGSVVLDNVNSGQERNIKFWLDYGTLLGAVRHKGFIPWDDDADISMLRDDYEKFVDLFNKQTPDKNLFAEWYSADGIYNMIKIRHKDVPFIWLDIFPCDFGYKKISLDEAISYTSEIKAKYKEYNKKLKHSNDIAQIKAFYKKETEKLEFIGEKNKKPQMVFYGLDSYHYREETIIFDYDMYFPLKEITFEGEKFPTLNQTELYLIYIFGDYMSLPDKISKHSEGKGHDLRSILALNEYLKD